MCRCSGPSRVCCCGNSILSSVRCHNLPVGHLVALITVSASAAVGHGIRVVMAHLTNLTDLDAGGAEDHIGQTC
ncbi:hypothetical protein L226DRAFT_52147 [Lentinus tigrinus ALCF2SS1-7]|uniref:uncharacterized protein n=1 Tax=Lentinus tigrinus ALCF2SS1-7 TaxID=1328758 RepID=UPI0011660F69|nr:hypothetical protein L226DRAFT_52147 [Lentinus tigrinus ALCF2SS1-7]